MAGIGFVGLGNMGAHMVRNLLKAGHEVSVFDIVPAAIASVTPNGAKAAANAAEAARGAEIVITMLPAGQHVRDAWLGAGGMAAASAPDALLIDCSTIDVALKQMGRNVIHCGVAGAGQGVKLCNNMMLAATMIVTSEAFVLAEKLGLSHQALFDVCSTSTSNSWALSSYCPVPGPVPASPANRDYKPGFAAALMAKDLGLAQEAVEQVGTASPIGAHALSLFRQYLERGGGDKDFSGIINMIREGGVK